MSYVIGEANHSSRHFRAFTDSGRLDSIDNQTTGDHHSESDGYFANPIGTTSNHPFWSVDRQEYVREVSGTKTQMHLWQHDQILDYKHSPGASALQSQRLLRTSLVDIWISGEVYSDIYDDYRIARIDVAAKIKEVFKGKSFDVPLKSLDCIAIIRDDEQFPEIAKYSKAKKSMDFRLAIPHAEFKAASSDKQRTLIVQMLRRSIEILKEKIPNCLGLDDLLGDVTMVAEQQGWAD